MIRILLPLALLAPLSAHAQEVEKEPIRVRAGAGAQTVPQFPGADGNKVSFYPDFTVARGSDPFPFEAADESFGGPLLSVGPFEFGPAGNIQSKRSRRNLPVAMDEVGFSFEAGAFAQLWATDNLRLRVEGRRGLSGHKAWVGSVSADYIVRDADKYVFSIGPRVTLGEGKYQRAYFGVNAGEAARTGLPQYRPDAGVSAVGAVAGGNYALGGRWGLVGYLRYDRLTGDAADSPFVQTYGSRDQYSGGLGLTYTFGRTP